MSASSSSSGRASGKVILLGEHMVVYGAPALAAGIDRGARAEATALSPGEPSVLRLGGDTLLAAAGSPDDRARAFAALLAQAAAPPLAVDAVSDLPAGGGLGSSAALGVAIARAVNALIEAGGESATLDDAAVIARASAWERVFHGNPSGIDAAAAAYGGCFRFTRVEGIRRVVLPRPVRLCIGWSGSSSSTREMVEGVARLHARRPEIVERSKAGVTALVENAALALAAGDLTGVGRLMDLNQMILAGLMLSTEALEQLCHIARDSGALGAKLTGAGGGGSVVALVDGEPEAARVLAAWKDGGFDGFTTWIHG